jgi:monolysocardiolipin acyltransferase
MLPNSHFFPLAGPSRVSRMNRWTLGGMSCQSPRGDQPGGYQDWGRRADNIASDIMFTNKLFSRFFNKGQVIDTIRGGGIFQPAVDKAIKLLQDGEWVCHAIGVSLMIDSYFSRGQD